MHAVRGGHETQQMQHSYVSEHIYTHNGKYIHKLNSDCTKCKPSEWAASLSHAHDDKKQFFILLNFYVKAMLELNSKRSNRVKKHIRRQF